MLTPIQVTVLAILDNAAAFQWSVQGFGMLRLYIRDLGRIHIWDSALRYPGVSMVHNHSWDLHSTVVSGRLTNTRFESRPCYETYYGHMFHGKRLITGYQTSDVRALRDCALLPDQAEHYAAGDIYHQAAHEIHRTDAEDGAVTLMLRREDENGQADVYWPVKTEWGTAKPRAATDAEVRATVAKAIAGLKLAAHETQE